MPRKAPRRKTYSGELAPLVPKKVDPIVKFLHPPEGTTYKEVPAKKRKGGKGRPQWEIPKKKIPKFAMYQPAYWELGLKPKRKNFLKKTKKRAPIEPLRPSFTLGTIVIVLAGRHKAKRAVFLKQLEQSGTLLLCGPKTCNGIKLMRIPQAYVIATKTKIDLSGKKITTRYRKGDDVVHTLEERIKFVKDSWFVDAKNFRKEKKWKKFKKNFFVKYKQERKHYRIPKGFKLHLASRAINRTVWYAVKHKDKDHLLRQYLSSKFRLRGGDKPHEMVF